jgi:ATP-dependent RNA helicase DeaD
MIDRLLDQGYASTDICSALIHLLQGAPAAGPAAAPAKPKPAVPEKPVKPAPAWVKPATSPQPAPVATGEIPAEVAEPDDAAEPPRKSKYERPARTGREPGMATIFLNVGRKQLVTPADIVGKIAGVTRLPASVVGAIDIHQRHTLADVAEAEAAMIVKKLTGIKLKGVELAPTLAEVEAGG